MDYQKRKKMMGGFYPSVDWIEEYLNASQIVKKGSN